MLSRDTFTCRVEMAVPSGYDGYGQSLANECVQRSADEFSSSDDDSWWSGPEADDDDVDESAVPPKVSRRSTRRYV